MSPEASALPAGPPPPRRSRRRLFRLATFGLTFGCALLFVDWVLLSAAGFPTEPEPQTAHPKSFREARHNVEFDYVFETNSQGLRSPELPLEKPLGERRLLVLGDSFTEGWGVETEATFCARLDQRLSRSQTRVINGGLAGTSPIQYSRLLSKLGIRYEPDLVLVCLYANDVANTPDVGNHSDIAWTQPPPRTGLRLLLHGLLPRTYVLASQLRPEEPKRRAGPNFVGLVSERARSNGVAPEAIRRWAAAVAKRPELVAAIERGEFNGAILSTGLLYPDYWADSIDVESERAKRKFASMLKTLGEIQETATSSGAKFALAYLPSPFQYDPAAPTRQTYLETGTVLSPHWTSGEQEIQRRLRAWAGSREIPLLDLTEPFRGARATEGGLDYPLDGHWTALGHRYAEKFIYEWLAGEPSLALSLGIEEEK